MFTLALLLVLMSDPFSLDTSAVMLALILMLMSGPFSLDIKRCYPCAYSYAYVGPVMY